MSARRTDESVGFGLGLRLDVARARRDASGPLVVPARMARTGNLTYPTGVEHRTAADVFEAASLATFDGAPVTVNHPREHLTMATRDLAVGYVRKAHRDGIYVSGELVLHDDFAIDAVLSGRLVELSAGYNVDLEKSPQVIDGEHVVGIQRRIRINHVALVGRGRAGAEVRVR